MGFYGNVFYQIANSFGKFNIKNSGLSSEQQPASIKPNGTPTTAIGLDATYNFDSGNKWIKLASTDEATMSIYHSQVQDINTLDHVNDLSILDKVKEVPEEEQYTALIAGDYLAIPVLAYDDAGHVVGINDVKYFRLPITTIEADLQELTKKVNTIADSDTTQTAQIKTCTDFIDNFEDHLEDSFIGDKNLYTTPNSTISLTQALGSINNLRQYYSQTKPADYKPWDGNANTLNNSKAILDLELRIDEINTHLDIIGADKALSTGSYTTVVEAINYLYGLITDMATNYQALNAKVIELEKRLSALEKS